MYSLDWDVCACVYLLCAIVYWGICVVRNVALGYMLRAVLHYYCNVKHYPKIYEILYWVIIYVECSTTPVYMCWVQYNSGKCVGCSTTVGYMLGAIQQWDMCCAQYYICMFFDGRFTYSDTKCAKFEKLLFQCAYQGSRSQMYKHCAKQLEDFEECIFEHKQVTSCMHNCTKIWRSWRYNILWQGYGFQA